ncbi:hypothetical protein [Pseudomonas sp. 18058]|nr:hypothetical protein [Pseudomonas sp. 18058]
MLSDSFSDRLGVGSVLLDEVEVVANHAAALTSFTPAMLNSLP